MLQTTNQMNSEDSKLGTRSTLQIDNGIEKEKKLEKGSPKNVCFASNCFFAGHPGPCKTSHDPGLPGVKLLGRRG